MIRRFAYGYSEGRAAHWLLLLLADRVDAQEQILRSLLSLHPDNPVSETGVVGELTHHGVRSRLGRGRTDLVHQALDPVVVAGPWVLAAVVGVVAVRSMLRRTRG